MMGLLGWSLVSHAGSVEECDGKDTDGVPDNEPAAQIGSRIYLDAFQAIDAAEAGDTVHICRGAVWSTTPAATARSGVHLVGHAQLGGQNPILVGTLSVEAGASVEMESLWFSHNAETLFVGSGAKVTAVDTRFEAYDTKQNIVLDSQATLDVTGSEIIGAWEGISGPASEYWPPPASQVHVILEDSVLLADSVGIRAGDDSLIEGGTYRGAADGAIVVQDTLDSPFTGATVVGARVDASQSTAIDSTEIVLIESSEIAGDIAAPFLYTFTTDVDGDVFLKHAASGSWWIATLTDVYGTVHLTNSTVEGVNDTLLVSGHGVPKVGGLIVEAGTESTVRGLRLIGAGTDEGPAILVGDGASLVFEGGEVHWNHVQMFDIEFVPTIYTTAIAVGKHARVELSDTFVTDNDSPAVVLQEGSTLWSACTWWGEGDSDNDFNGHYTPVDIQAGGQSWSFGFSDVWCGDAGCVSATPTCFSDPKVSDPGDGAVL